MYHPDPVDTKDIVPPEEIMELSEMLAKNARVTATRRADPGRILEQLDSLRKSLVVEILDHSLDALVFNFISSFSCN